MSNLDEELLGRLADLLAEVALPEMFEFLISNGFDSWDVIRDITPDILQEIGVAEDMSIKKILACIDSVEKSEAVQARDAYEEYKGDENEANPKDETQPTKITKKLVMSGTSYKQLKGEPNEKFMSKLLFLNLENKKISIIDGIEHCTNLQSLYLSNNKITKIENLDKLTKLQSLDLSNNLITEITGLDRLVRLKQLMLGGNYLSVISGLENLRNLEELKVSNQNLAKDQKLAFDPKSMVGLSDSLRVLQTENNNIDSLENIWFLSNLEVLKLAKNQIVDIQEFEKVLACLGRLKELDFTGSPITLIPKYRDMIVMWSTDSLVELNNKKIIPNERQYLRNLHKLKDGENLGTTKKKDTKPKANFSLSGTQMQVGTIDQIEPDPKVNVGLNKGTSFYTNSVHSITKKVV